MIPLQTNIQIQTPNTLKYDILTSTRIINGQLYVSARITMNAAFIDENGVWTEGYQPPVFFQIDNLEQYVSDNPDIAPLILQAWTDLSLVIDAVNFKQKLL